MRTRIVVESINVSFNDKKITEFEVDSHESLIFTNKNAKSGKESTLMRHKILMRYQILMINHTQMNSWKYKCWVVQQHSSHDSSSNLLGQSFSQNNKSQSESKQSITRRRVFMRRWQKWLGGLQIKIITLMIHSIQGGIKFKKSITHVRK